jgi:transketolase
VKATRDAYGEALLELGKEDPNVVVLDADLSGSTRTKVFADAYPERFFNMGIAEANMMGVAAGLARSGKTVFASTFAVFATGRAYDQIRQSIAYPKFNVKIVASHGGLTVGPDGATHQSLEDVALMRVIPNMVVIVPADARETMGAVRAAAKLDGPVYIRVGRESVPDILPDNTSFEIGKGIVLLPEGGRDRVLAGNERFDVSFIANGVTVGPCLEAAKLLEDGGITSSVTDLACVKPLDKELLLALAKKSDIIVTAEEHSVIGGLGGAVAEYLSENLPSKVIRIGVRDQFGQSGTAKELLDHYGLTGSKIFETVMKHRYK